MAATETTDASAPVALRTTAYLVIALLGAGIAVSAFLPWAGVAKPDAGRYDFAVDVIGVDAGGWGETAFVAGVVIALLGVLGYFWNPFSDPEAGFTAGFSSLVLVAAFIKMADLDSFVDPGGEFYDARTTVAPAYWVIIVCAALALALSLWILLSRPALDSLDRP